MLTLSGYVLDGGELPTPANLDGSAVDAKLERYGWFGWWYEAVAKRALHIHASVILESPTLTDSGRLCGTVEAMRSETLALRIDTELTTLNHYGGLLVGAKRLGWYSWLGRTTLVSELDEMAKRRTVGGWL